jgi:hypothetical protein
LLEVLEAGLLAIAQNTSSTARNLNRVVEADTIKVSAPDALPVDQI